MRNKQFYSALWYDVIRPEALKKASYKCENCSAKHHSVGYRDNKGEWIECDKFMVEWCKSKGITVKKLFLQIAHLDHNPSNNSPENLKALCPRCHLLNDKAVRLLSRISK